MKKIYALLLFCLICPAVTFAQIKVGQSAGQLQFPKLLNTKSTIRNLGHLKGKIVWLEFWATWCSPCVEAMPHLKQLQKAYAGRLQVIAISAERVQRIKQFIINQPSNLWFTADTAEILRKAFPYQTIPHSILIDQTGKVVAITAPGNITNQVIADVLAGAIINLPVKADMITEDPSQTYFAVPDTVRTRFTLLPGIKGLASSSRGYNNDNLFKGRRISLLNISLEHAYRIAYGNFPFGRTIDLTSKENKQEKEKLYCMDLIVPKGQENELLPTLRRHLKEKLDLQVKMEKRLKPVFVLTAADGSKLARLQKSATTGDYTAHGDSFEGKGIQLSSIAEYLEDYGIVDLPVVDGTKNTERYDISFTFMPEKKADLQEVLAKLGLELRRAEREIDMLVFR